MTTPASAPRDGRDPVSGRWLKGVPGTGRRHRIDLLSTCDRLARAEGRDLESLLWGVVKGLILAASKGDTQAAKILFFHFAADDGKARAAGLDGPAVVVNVDTRNGPALPDAQRMADYLDNLGEFAEELRRQAPRLTVEPAPTLDDLLA